MDSMCLCLPQKSTIHSAHKGGEVQEINTARGSDIVVLAAGGEGSVRNGPAFSLPGTLIAPIPMSPGAETAGVNTNGDQETSPERVFSKVRGSVVVLKVLNARGFLILPLQVRQGFADGSGSFGNWSVS
jgi:hypothetical protein